MKKIGKIVIALLLMVLPTAAFAQTSVDTLTILHTEGNTDIDLAVPENQQRLDAFLDRYRRLFGNEGQKNKVKIVGVSTAGYSSPTGSTAINEKLSRQRANAVVKQLGLYMPIVSNTVKYKSHGVDWATLQRLIENGDMPQRFEALSIIKNTPVVHTRNGRVIDQRKTQLQTLDKGRAWQFMKDNYFQATRRTDVIVRYQVETPPPPKEPEPVVVQKTDTVTVEKIDTVTVEKTDTVIIQAPVDTVPPVIAKEFMFGIKSNLLYDAQGIASLGGEIKISQHSTISLMLTYNPFRYGGSTYKNYSLQPEYRYWFTKAYEKFFLSANVVWGGFNIDKLHIGGLYGKQRQGHFTGGGIGWGYHLALSERFAFDFTLCADVVSCSYRRYTNGEKPVKEGKFSSVTFLPIGTGVSLVFKL